MSQMKRVKRGTDGKESATKVQVERVKRRTEGKKSAKKVAGVYLHVMEEVIQSVREDFLKGGVDESINLLKIRQLWESNLRQSEVTIAAGTQGKGGPAITRTGNPSTQLCDFNVPYGATDEFQSFNSTGKPIMSNCNPPGPSDFADVTAGYVERGKLLPWMPQPDPWINQKQWAVDVNGHVDEADDGFQLNGEARHAQSSVAKQFLAVAGGKRNREELTTGTSFSGNSFPQMEGVGPDNPPRLDGSQEDAGCLLEESKEMSFNPKLRRLSRSDSDTQVASL